MRAVVSPGLIQSLIEAFFFASGPASRPARGRFLNAFGLGQILQVLVIAAAIVAPFDRTHRGVGFQHGRVYSDGLPFHQAFFAQYLHEPAEHRFVRFHWHQTARPRHCRMIRRRFDNTEAQKIPQRKRVRYTPRNSPFRIDSFKVAEQEHPEIHTRSHTRSTHDRLVKTLAQVLQAFVDLVPLQDVVDLRVERVTRRLGNFLRAEKQRVLLRLALAHRHTAYDV